MPSQIDAYTRFSNAQAVTADAASDYIDLKTANRDLGTGTPLYVDVKCVVAMTDGSSNSTCAVTVQGSTDSAFTSPVTLATVGTFAAVSQAGTRLTPLALPVRAEATLYRYIRLYYTMANGDLTTGSFTASLTPAPQAWAAMPKGYTGPTT